jgi:hypothetical protein
VSDFAFHPELFESRALAIEKLAERGYHWLEHYSSVDLIQDEYGLEVCGIQEERDALIVLEILHGLFPEWRYRDHYYHDYERDRGWKALIFQRPKRGPDFKSA